MDEKGFRTVQCSCKAKLKFPVSEKNYGKTVKINCPRCETVSQVHIPVPANLPVKKRPDLDDLIKEFLKKPFMRDTF